MDRGLLQEAIKLNKEHKKRKRWNRFVRVLAGIVVFCTTYALILPAITLEKQPICGIEEHTHIEMCYVNTKNRLICSVPENGDQDSDTLSGNQLHIHDTSCYEQINLEEPELVCTLKEHEHVDECYPLEAKNEIVKLVKNQSAGVMSVAETATVNINIQGWNQIQFDGGNQVTCPVGSTLVLTMGSSAATYQEQNLTVTGGEILSITSTCNNRSHNHTNGFWCDANLVHTIEIKINSTSVNISGNTNWGWDIHTVTIKEGGTTEPIVPPDEPEEPDNPVVPDSQYKSVITGTVHINRLRFYNLCEDGNSGVSALSGCVFEIQGPNGYKATVTSGDNFEIELPKDIPNGEFTITEISTPEGYMRDTNYVREFSIENGALTSNHNIGTFINHSLEKLNTEKTAEVENYNHRIYEIILNAESHMRMYQMDPIDMLFVVDQSNSMLFPAGLDDTGKSVNLNLNGTNNIRNIEALNLDKSQMYYLISDPTGTSTVWSVWYENGAWLYQDTSYFVKAEQQNAAGYQDPNERAIFPQNRSYQDQKNAEAAGTRSNGGGLGYSLSGSGLGKDIDKEWNDTKNFKLYTAKVDAETGIKYNRLHYLEEALANMIYALADVNPENRVTLTGFTKEVDEVNDCIGPLVLTSDNAETLIDAVRSINTSGGTRQDIALKHIYENHLNDASKGYSSDPNENYTILITDGAPVLSSGSEIDNLGSPNDGASTTANSVYAQLKGYANNVKTRSSLMTVSLGMESVESGKQVLQEIASNNEFFCALDDASELVKSIQTMLFEGFKPKKGIEITGNVRDEISNSFYPIAWVDSGKGESTGRKVLVQDEEKDWILLNEGDWLTLEGEYTIAGAGNAGGQLLKNTNGGFYIQWTDVRLSNLMADVDLDRVAWVSAGTNTNRTKIATYDNKDWILLEEGDYITSEGEYVPNPGWYVSRYGKITKAGSDNYSVDWGWNTNPENRQMYVYDESWKGIFYVKAKEDFIGGNAIETNKKAWITVHDVDKYYDNPTVNVHLLDMNEMYSEVTVYLGDIINESGSSPLDSLKYFYNHTKFTKLISDGGDILNKVNIEESEGLEEEYFSLKYAIGRDLTETEWNKLINGDAVNIDYVYDMSSSKGPVGKFTIQLEKTGIIGANPDYAEHETTASCQPNGQPLSKHCTNPAELYTLHITYTAYELGEHSRPDRNVYNGTNGPGTEVGTGNTLDTGLGVISKENDHEVHVISGTIEITKEFEEGLTDEEDRQFSFTLHRVEDGEDTSKDVIESIIIPAGSTRGSVSAIFDKLRRGTYMITEAMDDAYMVKGIKVLDTTNCYSTPEIGGTESAVSFVMGNNIANTNVIGKISEEDVYTSYIDPVNGVYGAAKFTNKEIGYEGEIPVSKSWDDGAENHTDDEVYVILLKDEIPLLDSNGCARLLRLNQANNWKGVYTVVLTDKDDKVSNYNYSVKEVSRVFADNLYGWQKAVLENDGQTVLYYDKVLNDGDITGIGKTGYLVRYEESSEDVWVVKNYHAVELPETGGIGTKSYIYSGLVMITAALIYGYTQKQRQQRRREKESP